MSSIENIIKDLSAPVEECMRKPVTVSPSEAVSSILMRMVDKNIGGIIVVQGERPVGIVTEKDVLERVIMSHKDVYKTTAKDVMTKPIISIEHDRPIKEAIELMRKHNIRRLAITANGALVGLVTERRLSIKFLNKII